MAPEQASSGERVTPATDRYALGLVAYRLLTGESYFRGDPLNVLAQLLHEPLQPPSERHPELGKAFDAWFARACHRDPDARFTSAAEQIEALSAALGLPTIGDTGRDAEAVGPGCHHRSGWGACLVIGRSGLAVGAVLRAIAGVLLLRARRPPRQRAGRGTAGVLSDSKAAPAANLVEHATGAARDAARRC